MKMVMGNSMVALFSLLVIFACSAFASDPDMLQDLCVADLNAAVRVNGFLCKNAEVADDFFFDGLATPAPTTNLMRSTVTAANVLRIPGLNTLGVSMARIDFAPGGLNPPHSHPRATEIAFVLSGDLEVGFITTANRLITRRITDGNIFVFPRGLVHFQRNVGNRPAAVLAAFNSQNAGTQSIAATLFTSTPPVPNNVLAQAFQIDNNEVQEITRNLTPRN